MKNAKWIGFLLLLSAAFLPSCRQADNSGKVTEICNVSYDPTRELYAEYGRVFEKHWLEKTGEVITVEDTHAGSGAQSRAVRDGGKEADVVTLALAFDIDDIAMERNGRPGLLSPDWQKNFPNNSCPYISTIVIMVRKGNPKNIRGWDDLAKEGVQVVTPNPKTSGGARWNYLAVWGYALDKELADLGGIDAVKDPANAERVKTAEKSAYEFTKKVFANCVAQGMPTGARDATDDFVKRGHGDAFLAWENEAILSQQMGNGEFEIVVPEISIKCEPPVAIVDAVVDRRGSREIATEYLSYLYQPEGQEVIARNHYRPIDPDVMEKNRSQFPDVRFFTVDDVFGGWIAAQRKHFNSDGLFDQMLTEISGKQ
ncbi:MAG: sulfate ABC transporter substrate-binding protein [Thermoguttaceae bacterium]|nr:sulfate ABC transporter substrate-binding protein [Thermoguttaceae bacterium]